MASVTYKIGGKYDGKALKSAKKDFSDLAKVVKGFAVVKVAQELGKLANATKGVFVEQNKALTSFNTAVQKSGLELKKINDIKKELSHGNFIDDDSLNNAMKLGMQMGLNAEQLEKVTATAVNMASAGIKPLDKAMKELSKTALTNEKEFDELSARYDGFADSMSKTFSGRNTQWGNAVSDLKASIGAIPQSLQFLSQGKLLEPLNRVTEWLTTNRNQIINFFLNMPSIFATLGKSFTNAFKKTFENFPDWIQLVGVNFVQMWKDKFQMMIEIAKESFKGLMSMIDFAIGNPFRSSKDFINVLLNNLIEGLNGLAGHLPKWAKKLLDAEGDGLIDFRFKTNSSDNNKTWDETAKAIENAINNATKSFKDGTKNLKNDWLKILDGTTEFYKEDIDALKNNLKDILGKDLPEDLQKALDGMTFDVNGNYTGTTTTESKSVMKGASQVGSTVLSNTGEIGSLVQSIQQNGVWGAIATILTKIFARIEEVSPIFQYFQSMISEIFKLLIDEDSGLIKAISNVIQPFLDGFNAVKDILSGVIDVVSSILNVIASIFEIFTMILNKIAPVITSLLEVISIIFTLIGTLVEMVSPIISVILDVIAPILEVINAVIKAVYTIIANIINVIIDIYNWITWSDKEHVDTTMKTNASVMSGYSSYSPDLSGYATASATNTSGSASYTSAKDIYVNIYYNNSYVNGDAREIALQLRDEIRSAERLGY